ncbi:homocysteine S-methyltransferase family protein [Actinoplanes sp. NPDC023801]|uniref:homocysteine S-methyltransferase family protein n=1 Tax=Actinoplanes sp. NPDC023801 TaxID=3154595 RepID=UPI003402F069
MTASFAIPRAGLLLDGGLATELQRAGWPVAPPWWTNGVLRSPAGRRALLQAHRRYAEAGADVLTAGTFRCNPSSTARAGLGPDATRRLIRTAVSLARAAAGARMLVAGSQAPVADCYRPDQVPDDDRLRREHSWTAAQLAAAGVDLILVETMNTVREAVIAVEAVRAAGRPAWVSLVCAGGPRLLSGEPLAGAARTLHEHGAEAVLVNCTNLADTDRCIEVLGGGPCLTFGAYPNVEDRSAIPRWTHVDRFVPSGVGPETFACHVAQWCTRFGAGLVGGCCGTSPSHVAALRRRLGRPAPLPPDR